MNDTADTSEDMAPSRLQGVADSLRAVSFGPVIQAAPTAFRRGVILGTTIISAWMLSGFVWTLFYGPSVDPGNAASLQTQSTAPARTVSTEALKRFNPFGRDITVAAAETAEDTADETEDIAPETSLKLTLFGLRMEDGGAGSAIIQLPNGRQDRFAVGDTIIDGVTLACIHANWIEIRRAGRAESLFFKGEDATTVARLSAQRRKTSTPDTAAGDTDMSSDSTDSSDRAGSRQRDGSRVVSRVLPSASETNVRKAAQIPRSAPKLTSRDFETLLANTAMTPRREGGAVTGWQLAPRGSGVLFRSTGLRQDDVLIAVNGVRLTSPDQFAGLMDQLSGAESLEMLVERGGETRTLRLGYEG